MTGPSTPSDDVVRTTAEHELQQRLWMRRAFELAVENVRSGAGGPFGAVIVRGDKVVAEAANRVTATLDPTAHAEVVAIRAACQKLGSFSLEGCAIYTSCEPCPMCLAAIYWARLDAIYQGATAEDAANAGFDDARLYQEVRAELNQRSIPCSSLLREEAAATFTAWAQSSGRLSY